MGAVLQHEWYEHGPPDARFPLLTWRLPAGCQAIASASLGGGLGPRAWVLNAQVPLDYGRLDPERHLAELARGLDLDGPGVGLLTAAEIRGLRHTVDNGAEAAATVGVSIPTWAAAPDEDPELIPTVGTINIVCWLPEPLSQAALVNAVMTVTEAKSQALAEAQVPGTGTASDAVVVACPTAGAPQPFGGPRSLWGARLARAVHAAVGTGLTAGTT